MRFFDKCRDSHSKIFIWDPKTVLEPFWGSLGLLSGALGGLLGGSWGLFGASISTIEGSRIPLGTPLGLVCLLVAATSR